MRNFLRLCTNNIVGPHGFSLQVRTSLADGSPDTALNDSAESAFWRWSRRGVCDVSRKHSLRSLCNLVVEAVARDGETLVRKVYGASANEYQFGLMHIDIDRLDENKLEVLRDGRVIKMGVEMDALGAPIAYWIRQDNPHDYQMSARSSVSVRVPASEILHIGLFERPEQTRCLPWSVSAVTRLKQVGAYEEAAVVAANIGAAKVGYWKPGESSNMGPGDIADSKGDDGEYFFDFEPGDIRVGPRDAELKTIDWQYPHEQYEPFTKAMLRGLSAGLGVSHASLSNDLSSVNYSSIRTGMVGEREIWIGLQNWFVESFLEPVYSEWLRWALGTGNVTLASGAAIPVVRYEKLNMPQFIGRRWGWVDPKSDIEATIIAINNGLTSRTAIAAEQGRDLQEVWADLAREQDMAREMGITLALPVASSGKNEGTDNAKAEGADSPA